MLGGIRGPLYQQRAIHRRAVLIRKHHRPRGITSILSPLLFRTARLVRLIVSNEPAQHSNSRHKPAEKWAGKDIEPGRGRHEYPLTTRQGVLQIHHLVHAVHSLRDQFAIEVKDKPLFALRKSLNGSVFQEPQLQRRPGRSSTNEVPTRVVDLNAPRSSEENNVTAAGSG
jgi:hypothetical protein